MSDKKPLVGVVMGSISDRDVMEGCTGVLEELEIPHEVNFTVLTISSQQKVEETEAEEGEEAAVVDEGPKAGDE